VIEEALAPAEPQDFDLEIARSSMTAHITGFPNIGLGLINPFDRTAG
jgi:hypothetical protein